jgi:hypothetical protein
MSFGMTGEALTIADFSVAGLVPSAIRVQIPVPDYEAGATGAGAMRLIPALM